MGQTNSYLETFYSVSGIEGIRAENMWTPIIPNTSMIVFANGSSENKWALDLFINPSQKMWLILAATILILIVIGAIIIILHC